MLLSKIKSSHLNQQQGSSRLYQLDGQEDSHADLSSIEMSFNQVSQQDNQRYFQPNNNNINYGSISNLDSEEPEPELNNRRNVILTNSQAARVNNTVAKRCKILSAFVIIGLASVLVMGVDRGDNTVKMIAAIILIADFLCAGAYMNYTSRS